MSSMHIRIKMMFLRFKKIPATESANSNPDSVNMC